MSHASKSQYEIQVIGAWASKLFTSRKNGTLHKFILDMDYFSHFQFILG